MGVPQTRLSQILTPSVIDLVPNSSSMCLDRGLDILVFKKVGCYVYHEEPGLQENRGPTEHSPPPDQVQGNKNGKTKTNTKHTHTPQHPPPHPGTHTHTQKHKILGLPNMCHYLLV